MYQAISENDKPLAEQVAQAIEQMIRDSHLSAAEKLPNEFELAQRLGVGRGTIREAVKLLVSRNVLEIKRGKGTFVARNIGVTDDPLGLSFIQDKHRLVFDLQEIRFMIEPEIARMAAERATLKDVEEMRSHCAKVEDMIREGMNYWKQDVDFHTSIARSTQNLVIPHFIPIIHQGIVLNIDLTNRALQQETIESHRAIVEAIDRRDPGAASAAMTKHLDDNRVNLTAKYGNLNSKPR